MMGDLFSVYDLRRNGLPVVVFGAPMQESASFDTDDFFEAALRRSYGEQFDTIFREEEESDGA